MLASLHPTASSPRLCPPSCSAATASASAPSCLTTKMSLGLKPQWAGAYGSGTSNLSAAFHAKVCQSLRIRSKRPVRARITMMPIGTPRVPYRAPGAERAWQWVDLWNALYRERIIWIGQEIDEEYSNMLLATILYLDSIESSQKLYLYISCPGGDLTPSMAIYDTIQSLQSPVGTSCMSYAFDLAGFILSAGEKGFRCGMPLCKVAIQSPAGSARGRADDIHNEANELVRVQKYLYNELSKNTGQPIDKIYEDLKYRKRFNAQQAVEYGLIDRILRPSRIKPNTAPSKAQSNTGLG